MRPGRCLRILTIPVRICKSDQTSPNAIPPLKPSDGRAKKVIHPGPGHVAPPKRDPPPRGQGALHAGYSSSSILPLIELHQACFRRGKNQIIPLVELLTDRLRRFMISLPLLNAPNKNVIDLSPRASRVGEEIDLRRFPDDGSVLRANVDIRIKV